MYPKIPGICTEITAKIVPFSGPDIRTKIVAIRTEVSVHSATA